MLKIRNFLAVNDMADPTIPYGNNRDRLRKKKYKANTKKAQQRQTYQIIFPYANRLGLLSFELVKAQIGEEVCLPDSRVEDLALPQNNRAPAKRYPCQRLQS